MAELANLRNLERLTVSGTKVTPRSHKPGQPAEDDPEDDLSTDPTDPGPGITDAAIAPISRLGNLTFLDLYETEISDAGLKAIDGLVKLEVLTLPRNVSDAGLEHVQKLVKLRHLHPLADFRDRHPQINLFSDHGLAYLRNLTEIEELELDSLTTDEGLRNLRGMTRLKTLNTSGGTAISGDGLEHLQGMTKLRTLNLGGTAIDGESLKYLQGMTKLQTLNLGGTAIDGESLKYLQGMIELQELDLVATNIDDAGLEYLQRMTKLSRPQPGRPQHRIER